MREIVYKNLTVPEKRKKDFWTYESLENENIIARTSRHCIYKVKAQTKVDDALDINKWVLEHNRNKSPSLIRQFKVFKKSDTRTGEEIFMCKVVGDLYAVTNGVVFSISYMHIIKVILINLSNAKYLKSDKNKIQ